jgi:hypothetical protein
VHAQTFPGLEQEDFAEKSDETSQEHDAKIFSTFRAEPSYENNALISSITQFVRLKS